MLLVITTTGKTVLLIVAGLFIAWALVTAIVIPRRSPDFPLNLSTYLVATAVLFVLQMGAVYWVTTYQEIEKEVAAGTETGSTAAPPTTAPATTAPATAAPTTTAPATTAPATTAPATTAPATTGPATTAPAATAPAAGAGDPAAGKQVFATAGCGSCHTLAAAGASGTVGPSLDQRKPSFDKVVERVTNGKGVMPSFKGQLDAKQIRDVAAYVSTSVGR